MKEYQALKGKTPSLEFFKTPHLSAQVTCDAQRILGVDAAILFADLLPMLEPMGFHLDYPPGQGPVISNPVRSVADIDRIQPASARTSMPYIGEAIRLIRAELPANIPLIGFGGAPFTLVSYAIEGKSSKHYIEIKKFMHKDQGAWHELMRRVTTAAIDYLQYQIDTGVQAIQIFDSWVGCLSLADYRNFVFEHSQRLIESISGQVPVIHFGTGNPVLYPAMAEAGGDVMALDWRTPLVATWEKLGTQAIQGNLDPALLFADSNCVQEEAEKILREVGGRPGHIFNLGHGIMPGTPVDNVKALVDTVHNYQQLR